MSPNQYLEFGQGDFIMRRSAYLLDVKCKGRVDRLFSQGDKDYSITRSLQSVILIS